MLDVKLNDVGSLFTSIREAITGQKVVDTVELERLKLELDKLEQSVRGGQVSINKIEAQSMNVFIAGWRPFLGWVGGIAIAYNFILQPILWWLIKMQIFLNNTNFDPKLLEIIKPINLETDLIFNLVIAMLGFGGMRTFEKIKKSEGNR